MATSSTIPAARGGWSPPSALATWALIAGALAFAFGAGLYVWPDSNYSLALLIPVLLAMLRASTSGIRVVIAIVVAGDLAMTAYTHVSSATWAMSVATLVAVCFLALRIHEQREQILGLQREATERAERAERRERQLVDFIELVQHDVRLPLVAAQMQLKSAAAGPRGEDPRWCQARVGDAREALDQMAALLKNLVDVARQDGGFLPLQREAINLKKLVAASPGHGASGLDPTRVRVEVPDDLEVVADRYRLGRIVENLVVNALAYSPADTPVTIRAERRPETIRLSVIDRGIGIAAEDLPHIFEPGYRAAPARELTDGAGLGLHAARLFARAHGGTLSVESAPGQGSTFHLTFPAPARSSSRGARES